MAKKKRVAISSKTLLLFREIAKRAAPIEPLTVSEWADKNRYLSPEGSAEPGKWRTDRAPYQREIMDSLSDPYIETIIIKSSAQVGKSEIILNILGYFTEHEPAPVLLLQPTVDNAKDFSKDRVATMIRDTPVLNGLVKSPRTRDAGNTILHKSYPGGHLTLVGANSPASLASRPIRILLCDEVDRYPVSAGTEGDPVALAEKRTKTFWNRKKVYVSTPTDAETSKIEKEYQEGTMEEWSLPCPHCGRYQPLAFERLDQETAMMRCDFCTEKSTEQDWKSSPGKWIAQAESPRKRSFHLNALASPWESWERILEEFRDAKKKGKQSMKTWVNTFLGETWEDDEDEALDYENLNKRKIEYGCEVPEGVLILTAGVDVQDDRLEIEVVGWGANDASWGIQYKVFYGAPKNPEVWAALDSFLMSRFYYSDGSYLNIACTCIDTGGHYTTEVYTFCKDRERRWVYAIKGKESNGISFINKPTRNNIKKALLFTIGVNSGKERIYSDLSVSDENERGYCHFPSEAEKGYSLEYFKSLCSEKKVLKVKNGVKTFEWKKKYTRNEGLDLRNYARAAFTILNPKLDEIARIRDETGQYQPKISKKRSRRTPKLLSKGI